MLGFQGKRIGSGSFATVYVGRHAATSKPVAIKVVEHSRLNQKLKDNLEVEINVGRMMTHPNIVR